MKKLTALLLCLLSLASYSWSQTPAYAYQTPLNIFTSVATSGGFHIAVTAAAFHVLTWNNTGTVSTCQIQADGSADGITWGSGDVIPSTLCTTSGTVTSTSHVVNYIRINVTAISGAGATVSARLTGYVNNPSGGGLPSGCSSPGVGQLQCAVFSTTGGATAGYVGLAQGTAPATTAGSVQLIAPASVTAYNLILPGSVNTGFLNCVASGATGTCSFSASSTSNFYTNTTGTGIGPTSFTPATTNTLDILDSTATTGNTQVWIGYDGSGSFTGQHISAVRSNLSLIKGSGQGTTLQTDDSISFYTAAGGYRGGINVLGSNNALQFVAGVGVPLALGAAGGQSALIQTDGVITDQTGLGVSQGSTATISGGAQPVKADTANANQVVITTTTDTGAGIVVGVCIGNPTAGNNCHVIETGIAALTLGTGTCAIGNFVIVDTTTNGRVKCTSTYTAGVNIGVAMSAQVTVGSTLNVLVHLR